MYCRIIESFQLKYAKKKQGVIINPETMFDVQSKRMHEYKRQLMNALRIIYLCNKIRENPEEPVTPPEPELTDEEQVTVATTLMECIELSKSKVGV